MSEQPQLVIQVRRKMLVNTDPLRRCYNGAYFSTETVWSPWENLESMRFLKPGTDPQARLKFWRELNDYAVSQRGKGAWCEFRLVEETPQ